jgi:predicted KAP-like P-loop ATPase
MDTKDISQNPSQWLSADRPIETGEEDELDRRGFAEALANAVRGWSERDSLVLALYGAWGNGKSSIKNMVVESLGQYSPAVRCVDFNPWQLANRPSLSEAFFDELGVALGKGNLGTNSQRKSILNKYRRWALRLQGVHDLAKATRQIVGALLIFFGLVTLGSAWLFPRALSLALGILTIVMAFLALTTGVVEGLIKFLAAGTEVGKKSISEIKAELAGALKGLKTPLLVILDDLDRLTPQEILEVFQLIKANGDFPNVIYLILCDRTIVENNITRALSVPGRDYLEKIVQVAFDVPMIDVERVRKVLFSRLNSLLAGESISKRFESKRWANIFLSSLNAYFTTLRDVNRFISTLAFQISSFTVEGAFEVNPIDLIVLEVIRLYEPEVYKALQSNKEILTAGKPDGRMADATKEALNAIVELGSESHRKTLTELLQHLFPNAEWGFGGSNYAEGYGQQWYRDLRICSPKLFDRYFRLTVSDEELSQAVVQKLLNSRGDREQMRILLESLNGQGRLATALDELAIYEHELEPTQVEPFITAIFDVGDSLSETKGRGFEIPIQWRVGFRVQHAIEKLTEVESRTKVLSDAVSNTTGLSMAVEVVAVLIAKPEDETKEPFLPEAKAAEVKMTALRKIEDAATSGALARSPRLGTLLHLWRAWGNELDAVKYTERITGTPEGTIAFLKSMELRSVYQQIGDYVGTDRYYFQRNDIEPLISMDTLSERVNSLSKEAFDEVGKRVIENFQKAMDRRSAGRPDGPPFIED